MIAKAYFKIPRLTLFLVFSEKRKGVVITKRIFGFQEKLREVKGKYLERQSKANGIEQFFLL